MFFKSHNKYSSYKKALLYLIMTKMVQIRRGGNNKKKGGVWMNKKNDEVINGNMANTMEEVKLLGKQMEHMRDGQQLVEDERFVDPQQFDEEEE